MLLNLHMRIVWAILCIQVVFLTAPSQTTAQPNAGDPAKKAAADAPWKPVLAGADAKKVEELEKKITELRIAGKYAEAQAAAREILAKRTRVQGKDHWQTAGARRLLQTLEQIAALPPDARADLSEAVKLDGEKQKLLDRGRSAEAVPIARRALDLRRRHLGE